VFDTITGFSDLGFLYSTNILAIDGHLVAFLSIFSLCMRRNWQRRVNKTAQSLGKNRALSSPHQMQYFGTDKLLRFEMRAASGVQNRGQILHFLPPPVKVREGWGKNAELYERVHPTAEPLVIHLMGGHCAV